MEPLIVFLAICATIFGIAYVFMTTRNRERMALIEKGADASLFETKGKGFSIAKFILNIAILFVAIGLGILNGNLLAEYGALDWDVAIPSMIFISGGFGLIIGFFVTRRIERKE
ncbi:MAG: hypothetical protein JXQ90_01605 [Cyclobacteriaceae bacterium]